MAIAMDIAMVMDTVTAMDMVMDTVTAMDMDMDMVTITIITTVIVIATAMMKNSTVIPIVTVIHTAIITAIMERKRIRRILQQGQHYCTSWVMLS